MKAPPATAKSLTCAQRAFRGTPEALATLRNIAINRNLAHINAPNSALGQRLSDFAGPVGAATVVHAGRLAAYMENPLLTGSTVPLSGISG